MNATGMDFDSFLSVQKFMVEPVSTWSTDQMLLFPWLFIIPAEILGMISSALIHFLGKPETDLPHGRSTHTPLDKTSQFYIYFNRLIVLPFLSLLIVKNVWASNAVVFDADKLNWGNGLGGFAVVFALADFTYYVGHRVVHANPKIYKFVHKHHHGESEPIRGWADTCNAHPTDFFYTGVCTSPLSVLWLMPAGTVHIYAIAACLWVNSFVGSLGHCRLDLNVGIFDTRFHAGHHSKSTCNFAQNIELWDRLFGTYKDHKQMIESRKPKSS
jgi:sterol desaturase/sphingolipid hydroxylase (fatty acid hydroxylase superfamily)